MEVDVIEGLRLQAVADVVEHRRLREQDSHQQAHEYQCGVWAWAAAIEAIVRTPSSVPSICIAFLYVVCALHDHLAAGGGGAARARRRPR